MNYTLCNNSACLIKDDCIRWKNYIGQTASSVMNEQQLFIKTFEPFDEHVCKYKLIRFNS